MRKWSASRFIILTVIFIFGAYFAYRVYSVWQLNMRLEKFMAQQIINIQEDTYAQQWFQDRQLAKPNEYFITRVEAYYIYGNRFMKDREGYYVSGWVSNNEGVERITQEPSRQENLIYSDEKLVWVYSIRPLSGSVVCVLLEVHKPKSWTGGGMGSVAGFSEWSIDTSKSEWQLEQVDPNTSSCDLFRDTELLRTLLVFVH